MPEKFQITSEMLEPCFSQILSRLALAAMETAKTKGVNSIEFEAAEFNCLEGIKAMQRLALVCEGATHARVAISNEAVSVKKMLGHLRRPTS